jgi:hypothetical protein
MGFVTSSAPLQLTDKRWRTFACRSEEAHLIDCFFNVPLGVTLCENSPPTEVDFASSLWVT